MLEGRGSVELRSRMAQFFGRVAGSSAPHPSAVDPTQFNNIVTSTPHHSIPSTLNTTEFPPAFIVPRCFQWNR